MPWLQKICKSNHIVSVEEECCFHILFLLLPEVVKINITCPRGFKIWAKNVTHHCLSLRCGGYPRERVSIHDDSSQNSSQWSVKLWSLDFLGCVYLGYRPKTVPTFALALPKRICLWVFLRKVVCSVSVEKTALKKNVFTHLRLSDPTATAFVAISTCASSRQLANSASAYSHPADGYQQHQGA